ncbi:MAG: class I SAM-dependent methyltransferase [Deltaproteobacteria bacterium]|jgi:2-polyprenyl-3-methyl-5-hydroxy-6-metoxy-1,4-benzoquinol methylase|nr:class I SAM-dependent methyltransferase [Deltaproteobacteria bacterium]
MPEKNPKCPICTDIAQLVGDIPGRIPPIARFAIYHCPRCHFSFIPEYRTDYQTVYSEAYYRGQGADPLVNYAFDHQRPEITLRQYEWHGLTDIFRTLMKYSAGKARWLDYGCGLGSLVRYGRQQGVNVFGYEPYGSQNQPNQISPAEQNSGSYLLPKESLQKESFDYITAIEVIEHTADPLAFLRDIRPLLKAGGILFLTTGNAKPFRDRLAKWSYAGCPDVHISFFEPETLALALEKTGFKPVYAGYIPGFTEIIKYKILKNLGFKKRSALFDVLPWPILSRLADSKIKVTALPIGVAF